jgi:signal transduction histidine kinase
VVEGNKNLLKTALLNLIDNACKFSSNNEVDIDLILEKDSIILQIKDKGIGIAEKELNKILTPFYRGNNAISIKGSGIGLSLSSKIIDLHHWILHINSELNQGTVVTIKIPAVTKLD